MVERTEGKEGIEGEGDRETKRPRDRKGGRASEGEGWWEGWMEGRREREQTRESE